MKVTASASLPVPTSRRAGLLGGAAGLLAATGALAVGRAQVGWWRDLVTGSAPPQPVATGLEHLAGTAGALLLGWLAVLLLLGAALVTRGRALRPVRRLGRLVAPRSAARVAALLLTVAVAGPTAAHATTVLETPAATATATAPAPAPAPVPDWRTGGPDISLGRGGDADGRPAPQPGWQPPEPAHRADVRLLVGGGPRTTGQDATDVSERVVVRSGDTLWSIAARHLGPEAAPEDVAAEWPRWHAANRDVIGPDPDLIRPGQVLVAPSAHAPHGAAS